MKNIKYLILAVIAMTFHSCDDEFLNPIPDSAIVVNTFFSSDADVLAGLIGVYDAVQGVNDLTASNITQNNRGIQFEYMMSEMRSDNTRTQTLEGTKADFHRYRVDPTNTESEDFYQSMYEIIFRANNILDKIEVADAANQASYSAEAKFLRAFAYFKLVRLYGEVPLVTSVVGPTEFELLYTRASVASIYEQIVADLQEGIANLDNTYKTRASKAAAQGLLAKVYMTQPSRNYPEAINLCEAVINTPGLALVDDFSDVFYDERNSEIIFAVEYLFGNPLESQGFSAEFTSFVRRGSEDGHNIVNDNLQADFAAFGGNRGEQSYKLIGGVSPEVIKFLPEGSNVDVTPPEYGTSPQSAGNDAIVLRLADVLLMHAEAIIGEATSTSSSAAINSYMAVRERAGFDPVADRPGTLSKMDLLAERRVELAFENQRFYDLVRFGVADAVLGAHAADQGYPAYDVRKLLLPIPSREINLSNGLLTQNPGY